MYTIYVLILDEKFMNKYYAFLTYHNMQENMTRPVQQEEENLGYNFYIDAGIELNV